MKRYLIAALAWVMVATGARAQRDTAVLNAAAPLHRQPGVLVEVPESSDVSRQRFNNVFLFPGRNGSFFTLDMRDSTNVGDFKSAVRQYDARGNYLRTFGDTGLGPGRYSGGIGSVAQLADGRVLVSWWKGINVYAEDAKYLTVWGFPWRLPNIGLRLMVDPRGDVLAETWSPMQSPWTYRFREGVLVDSLKGPRFEFSMKRDSFNMPKHPVPFRPRDIYAWSPDGHFITAHTTTYAIDLRQDQVRSIRRSVDPVPVAAAEREDWIQMVTMYARSPSPGRYMNWAWSGPPIPASKPFFHHIEVDQEGRIWARVSQRAVLNPAIVVRQVPTDPTQGHAIEAHKRWAEPWVFDVFERTGRFVGQVQFPKGAGHPDLWPSPAFVATGDVVWAVTYDGAGTPTVRKYRIQWRD